MSLRPYVGIGIMALGGLGVGYALTNSAEHLEKADSAHVVHLDNHLRAGNLSHKANNLYLDIAEINGEIKFCKSVEKAHNLEYVCSNLEKQCKLLTQAYMYTSKKSISTGAESRKWFKKYESNQNLYMIDLFGAGAFVVLAGVGASIAFRRKEDEREVKEI